MCKTVRVDPLAQPTRARLLALLGELDRPATTAELATALGRHVNGVRGHLERLAAAGLLTRERQRLPRGRPRDVWALVPGAGAAASPQLLGRWLARAMGDGPAASSAAERTGREIGAGFAPPAPETRPADAVAAVFRQLGFDPQVSQERGGATLTLRTCPFRDAAQENPAVVCALHRGMTLGLLDTIAPAADLRSFVPHDPAAAGCTLRIATAEAR